MKAWLLTKNSRISMDTKLAHLQQTVLASIIFIDPTDRRYIFFSDETKRTVQRTAGIIKSRENALRQTLVDGAIY